MVAVQNVIRVRDLCREFQVGGGVVHALRHVDIDVRTGQLTILRGRSGSGKTTLMNMMGALDRPTSGTVLFNETPIEKAPESRRDALRRNDMGFVFQSVALISTMTAYENIEFGLRVSGYNPKARKGRAEECLHLVGLGKRMTHRPGELSGGEQQRVAIARAIAHSPSVIFADEPTAELDTHNGLQIVRIFRRLVEEHGISVVMTTHDPGMMDVADRVYTLEDGAVADER